MTEQIIVTLLGHAVLYFFVYYSGLALHVVAIAIFEVYFENLKIVQVKVI